MNMKIGKDTFYYTTAIVYECRFCRCQRNMAIRSIKTLLCPLSIYVSWIGGYSFDCRWSFSGPYKHNCWKKSCQRHSNWGYNTVRNEEQLLSWYLIYLAKSASPKIVPLIRLELSDEPTLLEFDGPKVHRQNLNSSIAQLKRICNEASLDESLPLLCPFFVPPIFRIL